MTPEQTAIYAAMEDGSASPDDLQMLFNSLPYDMKHAIESMARATRRLEEEGDLHMLEILYQLGALPLVTSIEALSILEAEATTH